MSKFWYKPSFTPKLLREFPSIGRNRIQIWETTCIVQNFGKSTVNPGCFVFVNPSNPSLSGVKKFSYFPRGGPEPTESQNKHEHHIMGYVSKWGGMEVGDGMMFSSNVIDGIVHQLGGLELAWHCFNVPSQNEIGEKCPVGSAVATPAGGRLSDEYDAIIHTSPPFFKHHDDAEKFLHICYRKSLQTAFDEANLFREGNNSLRVALPLLGAGCRGFPIGKALKVAAHESVRWQNSYKTKGNENMDCILAFGITDFQIAEKLILEIELSKECKS